MKDNFHTVEWEPVARDLYQRVKEEAAAIGDAYIGTPHLLLALLAVTPAEQHGIAALNRASVSETLLTLAELRNAGPITITPWSQTPRFKKAITHAMRRAFEGSRPVCRQDIWSGLLADPESEALKVLCRLGIQVDELSKAVV